MLLAILALLAQVQTIQLLPPDKAKPDDLKKAAEAMEARCKAFGYQDVTAAVVPAKKPLKGSLVELRRKDGFTEAMQDRISKDLSKHPRIDIDGFAPQFPMTQAQRDAFQPSEIIGPSLKDIGKWKAPPGAEWVVIRAQFGGTPMAVLIYKGGLLERKDFELKKYTNDGKLAYRWVLTESGIKKWDALPEAGRKSEFYISGNEFSALYVRNFTDRTEAGFRTVYADLELSEGELLCMANPLPFPLSLPEKK